MKTHAIVKGAPWAVALGLAIGAIGCDSNSDPAAALSPAGGVPVLAQAETFTDNVKIPVDILVFIPCADGGAGEDVLLSGDLHVVFHTTINGNRFNLTTHFQPQGISGVGLSTGDKYQATGVTQFHEGGSFVNGQARFTFVNNFRIIGQGPGNNFLVHETFHITFNANGDVTAEVDNFKIECK